jgi:hypothetical protein
MIGRIYFAAKGVLLAIPARWPKPAQKSLACRSHAAIGAPMLTLYNAAHSTCRQKVRIYLAEKGLVFEDIRLDLGKAKDHLKPEYRMINPNGVVPILVDDGNIIIDSSVVCEYLDKRYPKQSV